MNAPDKAVACIDTEELVARTLDLCAIESPAGQEGEIGACVHDRMEREGFAPRRIGMFPDRFNLLGVMEGEGDGCSRTFNEMGIWAITYGPPRSFRRQSMTVADLAKAAAVYARTAIEICGTEKPRTTARPE